MKHKFLSQFFGLVKDYHSRIIPENKVADCSNVIFRNGRVQRRYGFKKLGPDSLNGVINGIAYYEQVRLGNKFVLVFTSRDAYLYDTTTGRFTPVSLQYVTGTVKINNTAVTGVGTTWLPASWTLIDKYQMKLGTNNPGVDTVTFTGNTASPWTERTGSGSRNWVWIASSSDGVKLAAIVATGYIYTSADSGATWIERTTSGSRNWGTIASSSDGVKLAATTLGGYIYTSTDSGATWTERTACGSRYWFPISCSADGVKLVAAVKAGGGGYIYTSTDSGATWAERTGAGSNAWVGIASSSDGTKLAVISEGGDVYTSTDSGATWTARITYPGGLWLGIACSSDGVNIVRIKYAGYIYISHDSGVTWIQCTAAGNRNWQNISMSADGTKIIACPVSGYIYLSIDSGVTWTEQTAAGSRSWRVVVASPGGTTFAGVVYGGYVYFYTATVFDITSVSSLAELFVGLELTASFLQPGSRIKAINFGTSVITVDKAVIGSATGASISADISGWYDVHSVDSGTGITLNDIETSTGDTTNGSAVVINIPDTSILHVGMGIGGTGIPANTTILSIDSATQITMSANATATNTGVALHFGVVVTTGHEVHYVLKLCFNGDSDDFWFFAYPYSTVVGDKMLVATNGIDPLVKWKGSGNIEYLTGAGKPDTAKYIGYFGAAMYEHFIAAWTTDGGNNLPQTLEFSDAGNAEAWSGVYYDLLQTNDEIVGIEILKDRLVIYKKRSMSLAWPTPQGSNTDPVDISQDVIIDIEIPVGRTVVNFGDFHIFLGLDNVYKFNGISIDPIGEEVINTMKNEWNGEHMNHAFAFAIPNENLYCLFIPTLAEYDEDKNVTKAEAIYPDRAYVYNYQERTWTIWKFSKQITCSALVNKFYAPTVADIDVLNQTYADMQQRWADLIAYSRVQSILLGDVDGNIYELRDVYNDDDGTAILATFRTRDYELNDPKHVFMLVEAVVGMAKKTIGNIQIRASVDFGETWSAWETITQAGVASYVEYIANFNRKGKQVEFEIQNEAGADFAVESINVGFNDEMGKQK